MTFLFVIASLFTKAFGEGVSEAISPRGSCTKMPLFSAPGISSVPVLQRSEADRVYPDAIFIVLICEISRISCSIRLQMLSTS